MVKKARQAIHIMLCLAALSGFLFGTTPASAARVEDLECTYIVPESVNVIDGAKNYTGVKPGDVFCLTAGVRGNLKLVNLHGDALNWIVVKNTGGQVIISGHDFLTGGIGIEDSSYLRVTGSGVSNKCGAEYSPEEMECGIEVGDTHKGIKLNTGELLNHIELDHLFVHDTNPVTKTRGIAIHPHEGELISGIYIHHNYVLDTLAEGIYIGTEPHGREFDVLGKLENVEVSYNRVENIGYDGIKLKVAFNNVKVHHNMILNVGTTRTPAHEGGIKIAMSVGEFYNNFIMTDVEGIRNGRPLDETQTRYYNNVVIGAQDVGIEALEDNAMIYNNTVINSGALGINAEGKNSQVFNNIVAGTAGIALGGDVESMFNNLVGDVLSIGFLNPAENDYRLLHSSPAIDSGTTEFSFVNFDFSGKRRPIGDRLDIGAYERSLLPRKNPWKTGLSGSRAD